MQRAFVVGGWAEGEGGRKGRIGGLLIGGYRSGGLVYAGRVGSGQSENEIAALLRTFADLHRDTSPFDAGAVPRVEARGAHWVEPRIVIEVAFAEWTNEGRVRHPSYQGQLPGADPRSVTFP